MGGRQARKHSSHWRPGAKEIWRLITAIAERALRNDVVGPANDTSRKTRAKGVAARNAIARNVFEMTIIS